MRPLTRPTGTPPEQLGEAVRLSSDGAFDQEAYERLLLRMRASGAGVVHLCALDAIARRAGLNAHATTIKSKSTHRWDPATKTVIKL